MPSTAQARSRPVALADADEVRVVLCGVEDTRADRAVAQFAAGLSERVGGRLILLHVQPPPLMGLEPQIAYAASQPNPSSGSVQLAAARELARLVVDLGVAPSTEVRIAYGALEPQLLEAARDEQATVLVVGPRPASRIVGGAPCPVAVVPVAGTRGAAWDRSGWGRQRMAPGPGSGDARPVTVPNGGDVKSSILCGVDGSQHARLALRHAARLAGLMEARLVVAHVVQLPLPSPRIGPTAGQLTGVPIDALLAAGEGMLAELVREEGLEGVERRVSVGFPADRLADVADEERAELLVVGSRGRGPVKSALLGSVSADLVGVARCPVLVVPPQALPPSDERAQPAGVGRAALR